MDQILATATEVDPSPRRLRLPRRITEARLIRAARAGSADAAEEIVRRFWNEAERTAALIVRDQHAAEDIAQEALLTLLASLGRFDERRRLGPWLNRIVVNRAIDWARKYAEPVDQPSEPRAVAPAHPMTDPELLDALHRLAPTDRAAIVMRAVLGHRAVEIAELLGEPAGTTRSRIHRALKQLRADLRDREKGRPHE